MKELNIYISEKLRINKDMKMPFETDYVPQEEDYELIEKDLSKQTFTSILFTSDDSYKDFDQAKLMRVWIASMQLTGAMVVGEQKVRNDYMPLIFPCNFGVRMLKRLVHHFDMKIEDILEQYHLINTAHPHNPDKKFIEKIENRIYDLVKIVFHNKNKKFEIELKIDDPEKYSEYCLGVMQRLTEACTVPFIIKHDGKECPCEVTFVHLSYYNYIVDGKSMRISEYFYNELVDFFNK